MGLGMISGIAQSLGYAGLGCLSTSRLANMSRGARRIHVAVPHP